MDHLINIDDDDDDDDDDVYIIFRFLFSKIIVDQHWNNVAVGNEIKLVFNGIQGALIAGNVLRVQTQQTNWNETGRLSLLVAACSIIALSIFHSLNLALNWVTVH